MAQAIAQGTMVGGHGLIARRGQVVYDQVWGMADRETGRPMQADALYRIYSMSKPITAVALMMLYEEGRFLLSDPIARFLPELANLQLARISADGELELVAPKNQPTVLDLLRHTAGLTYGVFGDQEVDRQYRAAGLLTADTLEHFTEKLGALPLAFEPGTRWHYSVAADVQGRLVEVISGLTFGEFLEQRIFEPLKMRDTSFVVPTAKHSRLAQLYNPIGGAADWDKAWTFSDELSLAPASAASNRTYLEGGVFESGGAGLVSSTYDYLRFALMLANGGVLDGVRLLSPRTIEHMRNNHLQGINADGLWDLDAFGLGFGLSTSAANASGELGADGTYGWGGAAGTRFWIDPVNDIVGLFMVQSVPHQTDLAKKFHVLMYQALID